jgi:phenolic acid decarboxylase
MQPKKPHTATNKADDFAIGFAQWLFEHYNKISCYDIKELLKIYKKQYETAI